MLKTIFVVDDSLSSLSLAEEALEKQYRVITLSSANKMYAALEKITPDLILLDIAMPEMSGFDAMKQLKSNPLYTGIPVIFLTALTDTYNEALGIELGAVDFITKPFSEPVLLNRIKNQIQIDEIIRERTSNIMRIKNGIVFSMADIIEKRDKNTGGHVERVTEIHPYFVKRHARKRRLRG
jgi:putative two-component system response regulator